MKHRANKRSVIAILSAWLILLSMLLTGCVPAEEPQSGSQIKDESFEKGFSLVGDPSPFNQCACRSDKSIFDINDVTLTFFYGADYKSGVDYIKETTQDYPEFDIYFSNDSGKKIHVKHVEENFVSEKYHCEHIYIEDDDGLETELRYNHSEIFTIPQELFDSNSGLIYFEIEGVNVWQPKPPRPPITASLEGITGLSLNYKIIEDNRVYINPYYLPKI